MRNNKGFSLIEALVASTIIFFVMITFVPIMALVKAEQKVANTRLAITNKLHDQLQVQLLDPEAKIPHKQSLYIDKTMAEFHFLQAENLIKGCAKWQNAKNEYEEICLFGYPEK